MATLSMSIGQFNPEKVDLLLEKEVAKAKVTSKDTSKKSNLRGTCKKLLTNVSKQKNQIALSVAQNPRQKAVWDNIAKNLNQIKQPQASAKKINKCITEMFDLCDKITQVCDRYKVPVSEYRQFIEAFDGDVNCEKDGMTPLRKAIQQNRVDLIPILCELGAKINFISSDGWAPLERAINDLNLPMVKCLVEHGANVDFLNPEGWTPIEYAIENGSLPILECLIEHGAVVNFTNPNGWTPLISAIEKNNLPIIECLIKARANVDLHHPRGNTPLTCAIENDNLPMVEYLIKAGANVNLYYPKGKTPLTCAIENNNLPIVECLVKAGANVNFSEEDGDTPIKYAIEEGFLEIAQLLKKHGADEAYAKKILEAQMLAHIWGLGGNTTLTDTSGQAHKVDLEGLSLNYTTKQLFQYFDRFLATPGGKAAFKDSEKREILSALSEFYPDCTEDVTLKAIEDGLPRLIVGGSKDHCISMVIHQRKLPDGVLQRELHVCNRGANRKADAVEIFAIPQDQNMSELLESLGESYDTTALFYENLAKLNFKNIGGYNQKDLRMGTCSWANPKAAVGVLCRLFAGDARGKEIYKLFTAFCRQMALRDYLKSPNVKNKDLLTKIRAKCSGKKDKAWAQQSLAEIEAI